MAAKRYRLQLGSYLTPHLTMRNLHIYLSALSVLHPVLGIRHGSSELRDLEAFPKFEVQFLNHLPVAESEAKRSQSEGIRREEEWVRCKPGSPGMQQLGDGTADWAPAVSYEAHFLAGIKLTTKEAERLELIRMALKNPASNETQPYLCLMPSASKRAEQNVQAEVEPVHEEIDPLQAWSALGHLEGKCLYAKQGWFTYA
jgi:protein OS-9